MTKDNQRKAVDQWSRDVRFERAQKVLATYTMTVGPATPDGLVQVSVTGGSSPYLVTIDPLWRACPTCTCPDAQRYGNERNAGFCKHIIATLLQTATWRCQLLDLFLGSEGGDGPGRDGDGN